VASAFFAGLGFEAAVRLAAEAGFREMELLCADGPPGDWYLDPAAARRVLDASGMKVRAVHSHPASWDNAADDEARRHASVKKAVECFGPAAEVGAGVVTVHPNYVGEDRQAFAATPFSRAWGRSRESLASLAEVTRAAGLHMALENMPARGLGRPGARMAEVLSLIEGLGPHVGVCLDAGHANANGLSVADEARAAGGRVLLTHFQDNDGKGEDQHWVPGEGTTDWTALRRALDESAPGCVRTFEVGSDNGNRAGRLQALARLRWEWET
jgi:sugar phosphate isomerase/epimerase